ncbi:uncharacterized protein LOC124491449 [Dermatophagoides farinae]|uniref:uncharacterized protein LOC124491449 n=1 Tax=Dermatophagoides farinae TaxID=6954 RepID=UPI003F64691E
MMYYLNYLSKILSPCYRHCSIDGSYINKHKHCIEQQIHRHMAYVSNKRITRLCSEIEVDKSELNQNGNEKYIDVRLKNRNPRNLEQMLMEPKPMGYEMDEQNCHYWNKVVLVKRSKYLIAKIIHHSGRTTISAATNEPSLAIFLGSKSTYTDVKAAKILGQVLAMRALESGIHSIFYDHREYGKSGEKLSSFIDALKQNGLNLDEQPVIFARAQQKRKFKPRWISFEMMKSTSNRLPYVEIIIVTDRFDDEVLNFFHDKCRIVGPLIITYCDNDICPCPQSSIPQRTWPIYSQCMRGLEVTTSDIPTTKRQFIENRVKLMSGHYHENLHINTSVLVSDSVLTRKARAAAENHIPIVTVDWIESCWIKYQHEYKQANEDSIISKYRLPIFHGLNIVLSGLNERDKISNIVESNGGKYHSVLKIKPVLPNTILLLPEKRGEKYLNAKRLNIPCLLPKWLDDSIQASFALPFENYMIDNLMDEDSPTTTTTNVMNKRAKTVKIVTSTGSAETKTESNNLESIIKEISESNQSSDQIFDGNSIHATGFDENVLIMIRNCAKKFGAFFYDSLCDSVTDVIVGPNITKTSFQKLSESEYSNHLVSIDWFIDRIRLRDLCSQNNYLIHSYSQLKDQSSSITNITSQQKKSDPFEELGILNVDPNQLEKLIKLKDEISKENSNEKKSQRFHYLLGNDPDDTDSPDFVWNHQKKLNASRTINETDWMRPTTSNDMNIYDDNDMMLMADNNEVAALNLQENQSSSHSFNDQIQTVNTTAVFMFSEFNVNSKTKWEKIAHDVLNIIVKDDRILTKDVTHLILNRPRSTEKVFSAIAAGAFILKPEYIYESILSKKLLAEENYQWGMDSDVPSSSSSSSSNTQLNEFQLMKVAIEWKHEIVKNNRKVFEDLKILLLDPMYDDAHLNSCANILRAGGANVITIFDKSSELLESFMSKIIDSIDLAIINPNWKEKPKLHRKHFMNLVDYFHQKDRLANSCVIVRFISQGPKNANMETLRQRYPITNEDVRNHLSKFY